MPTMIGVSDKQKKLIADLPGVFREVARVSKDIADSDLPPASVYQEKLISARYDFKKFKEIEKGTLEDIAEALNRAGDLSKLHSMGNTSEYTKENVMNPFENASEHDWAVPYPFQEQMNAAWKTVSPEDRPCSGAELKNLLISSRAQPIHLKAIWPLCDFEKNGQLDREEFILAMWLGTQAADTGNVPTTLPPDLIPLSKRSKALFK